LVGFKFLHHKLLLHTNLINIGDYLHRHWAALLLHKQVFTLFEYGNDTCNLGYTVLKDLELLLSTTLIRLIVVTFRKGKGTNT